jgi:hypothetical protein
MKLPPPPSLDKPRTRVQNPGLPSALSRGAGNYWVSDHVLSRGRLDRRSQEQTFVELQIQNLSKVYKNGVRALDNVSLTIPVGM